MLLGGLAPLQLELFNRKMRLKRVGVLECLEMDLNFKGRVYE
jgi:hypothetical protein